jgi:hypothetical protein
MRKGGSAAAPARPSRRQESFSAAPKEANAAIVTAMAATCISRIAIGGSRRSEAKAIARTYPVEELALKWSSRLKAG